MFEPFPVSVNWSLGSLNHLMSGCSFHSCWSQQRPNERRLMQVSATRCITCIKCIAAASTLWSSHQATDVVLPPPLNPVWVSAVTNIVKCSLRITTNVVCHAVQLVWEAFSKHLRTTLLCTGCVALNLVGVGVGMLFSSFKSATSPPSSSTDDCVSFPPL